MTLRERFERNPRTLMRVGAAFLILALVAQKFVRPSAGFTEDVVDAVRGCALGLSIGLNLWYVRVTARRGCGSPR